MIKALRAFVWPAVVAAVYLVLGFAFGALTEDDGLLQPSGIPRWGVAALGLLVLVLRLAVVFVVPAVCVYRVVMRLLGPRS